MRIKPTIYLSLLTFYLSSCQWTSKIETGVIILPIDSLLPNYSYKEYDISPFVHYDYKMPFTIGEEYLVMYQKKGTGICLEKHLIVDTVIKKEPCNTRGRQISIPVFDDESTHSSCLDEMLFFNGFETYNTNIRSKIATDCKSETIEKTSYDMIFHSWKRGEKKYSIKDKILKKSHLNEISFSIDSKEQVLIRRSIKYDWLGKYYEIISITDLDGDGVDDLILRGYYEEEFVISYLLFLSSEAEDGNLLKHVATKTFLYDFDSEKSLEDWGYNVY